jgi:hypothetical protein
MKKSDFRSDEKNAMLYSDFSAQQIAEVFTEQMK